MESDSSILVSGASGLVGSALCALLEERGYQVRRLSRSGGDISWDPAGGDLPAGALDGVSAVMHLAGEPIAQRWTAAAKQRILESRVQGTALLARAIAARDEKPAFIVASGINFYGSQAAGTVDETSPSGDGFLAEVCRQWEAAVAPAAEAGARSVFMRTGIVLSARGGALAKMLPPFKLGLGGPVGSGDQRMSWISLPDLAMAFCHALENEAVEGAVNAVAPEPVDNRTFAKALARRLKRPAFFPLPSGFVKAAFGEMGEETLLADLAVRPAKLERSGYTWTHPTLEAALAAVV